MILTPSDLDGTQGFYFEKDGTASVRFSDGSSVIMDSTKPPQVVEGEKNPHPERTLAAKWLESKLGKRVATRPPK